MKQIYEMTDCVSWLFFLKYGKFGGKLIINIYIDRQESKLVLEFKI